VEGVSIARDKCCWGIREARLAMLKGRIAGGKKRHAAAERIGARKTRANHYQKPTGRACKREEVIVPSKDFAPQIGRPTGGEPMI